MSFHGGKSVVSVWLTCKIGTAIVRPDSNAGSIGTPGFAMIIGEYRAASP